MSRVLSCPDQNLPNKAGGLLERWARWAGPSGQCGKGVGVVPTSAYWEGGIWLSQEHQENLRALDAKDRRPESINSTCSVGDICHQQLQYPGR